MYTYHHPTPIVLKLIDDWGFNIRQKAAEYIKETGLDKVVKPILHPNQYFHLLKWLEEKGQLTEKELKKAREIFKEELFEGV